MYDIPFDRSFLQLSNGIRHVMPSTDKARINNKGIDDSARLTAGCVCQLVKEISFLLSAKLNYFPFIVVL
jgi:hypothetical protein